MVAHLVDTRIDRRGPVVTVRVINNIVRGWSSRTGQLDNIRITIGVTVTIEIELGQNLFVHSAVTVVVHIVADFGCSVVNGSVVIVAVSILRPRDIKGTKFSVAVNVIVAAVTGTVAVKILLAGVPPVGTVVYTVGNGVVVTVLKTVIDSAVAVVVSAVANLHSAGIGREISVVTVARGAKQARGTIIIVGTNKLQNLSAVGVIIAVSVLVAGFTRDVAAVTVLINTVTANLRSTGINGCATCQRIIITIPRTGQCRHEIVISRLGTLIKGVAIRIPVPIFIGIPCKRRPGHRVAHRAQSVTAAYIHSISGTVPGARRACEAQLETEVLIDVFRVPPKLDSLRNIVCVHPSNDIQQAVIIQIIQCNYELIRMC